MRKPSEHEDDLERRIARAARVNGWLLPETENEVAVTEQYCVDDTELPVALRDPMAALKPRPMRSEQQGMPPESDGDTIQQLAQAARNGSAVSAELRERMRADRRASEDRKDKAKK